MTAGTLVLIVVIAGVVAIVLYAVATYNALVGLRNQIRNAWAQIEVQLKRRHDLIPNLVETAKGYMVHERSTLEEVTKARTRAASAKSVQDISQAETGLSGALVRFMAIVENYPDLKANQNFLALQEELTSTENRIAFSRQAYNDQVLFLNNKVQMFPSNIIAGMFKFTLGEFFELEDSAQRAVPKVQFS
ncbi:MAG TPA: LemA family protein [Deltaproteobacteria bacterium]|nr:LemA family protein [Deltaproteobacteria bacterium]